MWVVGRLTRAATGLGPSGGNGGPGQRRAWPISPSAVCS